MFDQRSATRSLPRMTGDSGLESQSHTRVISHREDGEIRIFSRIKRLFTETSEGFLSGLVCVKDKEAPLWTRCHFSPLHY